MTAQDDEARWKRRMARVKDLNSEAYDLFDDICELDGGPATVQGTPERLAHFKWVHALPRFNPEARRRALSDPL
jgi:hypothetical protein